MTADIGGQTDPAADLPPQPFVTYQRYLWLLLRGAKTHAGGMRTAVWVQVFTASNDTLFTPNFLLAPFALSEMNWYSGLSCTVRTRSPTSAIMLR